MVFFFLKSFQYTQLPIDTAQAVSESLFNAKLMMYIKLLEKLSKALRVFCYEIN